MAATADKIPYSDPSAQIADLFLKLGGQNQTGTTTSTSSADPASIDALHQLLTTQLGQTTPEGISALINSIFTEGARKVPGIQTAYGQAVGARASGNSPSQLALGDLQTQLSAEAMKQLMTAQVNAGQTASRLADVTGSKTASTSQVTKPRAITYLPFALGQLGKLKGYAGDVGKVFGMGQGSDVSAGMPPNPFSFDAGGAAINPGMDLSGSGADLFNFGFGGNDAPLDLGGFASDMGSSIASGAAGDAAGGFDFGNFDLGFADGGLVDLTKMKITNPAAEAAFNSGGDEEKASGTTKKAPADSKAVADTNQEKDITGRKSLAVRLIDHIRGYDKMPGYANGGMVKAPGYAGGGQVARADYTKGITDYLSSGGRLRGYDSTGFSSYDPVTAAMNSLFNAPQVAARATPGLPKPEAGAAGSSGVGEGTTNGPVGTPSQNSAALGGMGIAAASAVNPALGIAVSLAMDALGISHSSMNPVSQIASLVHSIVSNASDSPPDSLPGTMDTPAPDGFSSPNDNGMSTGGMDDGTSSDGQGGIATSGEGSVGSGEGSGPGDSAFENGGKINGPSKPVDKIGIKVTGGEYIFPKDSVDFFGVDYLDFLKNISHTPVQQQGAQ